MTIYRALLLTIALASSLPVNGPGSIDYKGVGDQTYEVEIEEPYIEPPLEHFPISEPKEGWNLFNNFKLILKEDIASEDVLKLKRFLLQKGYMNKAEGYYFDFNLKGAVINYQRDNNLLADGIVGIKTFNKINEDIKFNGIYIPERKPYFTSEIPKGQWIFINKSSNTLYHLNGQDVIRKYNVASGKTQVDTPEGKFSIIVKQVNPAWGGAGKYEPVKGGDPTNPLGKRWMGLNIGGGGQYGIHGNASYNSIGKYVSLGCIRMYNDDVEYLYELVQKGTPVWIANEYKLNEFGIVFK